MRAQVPPGDESGIAQVRAEYGSHSEPVGTMPPPASIKGAVKTAGKMMKGQKPTVLLDRSPELTYVVQSGLVGAPDGQSFPNHQTPFRLVSTNHELTGDNLQVVFEAESGGLTVTKTYTLHRGRYDIDVQHALTNTTDAALSPSLYLQLERDGNDPADTSSFYHTFTGVAVYS